MRPLRRANTAVCFVSAKSARLEPIPEGGINLLGPMRRPRRKPAEPQPSWSADGKIMTVIKEIPNLLQRDRCLCCNVMVGVGRGLIVLKALNRERADKAEIKASLRKSDDKETHGCGGGHTAFLHTALRVQGHNRIKKTRGESSKPEQELRTRQ